ncbi:unnamed protein product, partial [Linum tenue]
NSEATDEIINGGFLQFDFQIIRAATNDFSIESKLGEGGFGVVYKGMLSSGQEVAVKRLRKDSAQGDIEFKNEVKLVAKLQHRNLVRLLGFCLKGRERLLIYEFIPNASLDHFLFDVDKRKDLNWERRYKIIIGVTRGMIYLHEDSRLKIIHRDLKASNILLDVEMDPKISDFGMARLFDMDETRAITNRIVGTYGYMAPEYAMHGQFSVKSDVFSFGVLILEIVSGHKNKHIHGTSSMEDLLSYAWKNWRNGTCTNLVDPSLGNNVPGAEVARCIHIGLLCVQENVNDRPTMAAVALMLSSHSVTLPLPSKPAFFIHNSTTTGGGSSSRGHSSSDNSRERTTDGTLSNGQEVAVKRLKKDSAQGHREFKNEVKLVAKLEHRNLVKLLGFCLKGGEMLLIYEFIPNASLDHFLFDVDKKKDLSWERRYKIIIGVTRGMTYLHEESRLRIIHRDLKASNILLDAEMVPKISDFGMARLFDTDETRAITNRIVGTYGYMAPEYAMHGQFSVKSDVFSFGVFVLEIVSSKKNKHIHGNSSMKDLLSYAWRNWRNGTYTNLVDPSLGNNFSGAEVARCIHIGLLCVQENVNDRPTMAAVALMLTRQSIALPLPSKPAFFVHTGTGDQGSSSSSRDCYRRSTSRGGITDHNGGSSPPAEALPLSRNEVSVSELYPR